MICLLPNAKMQWCNVRCTVLILSLAKHSQRKLKQKEHYLQYYSLKQRVTIAILCPYCIQVIYDLQMSLVKHQFCGLNQFWILKQKECWGWFLWQVIFEIFQVWTKNTGFKRTSPYLSLFETFSNNRPFILNHHQIIK